MTDGGVACRWIDQLQAFYQVRSRGENSVGVFRCYTAGKDHFCACQQDGYFRLPCVVDRPDIPYILTECFDA